MGKSVRPDRNGPECSSYSPRIRAVALHGVRRYSEPIVSETRASHPIALLYDDDAYVETLDRPQKAQGSGPMGLMGRQVAGKEFLDAYLEHGRWNDLVALVRNQASADSLVRL